ncbi:hypothetical protein [Mesobacillus jeotgali]|uniref:hypothetical protein n=1 Tax=Mesobacillus jeotgali TaxID=129985 RepID=UPI001CFC9D08|nr:hypothetical protein [Mesobacillus jeotgali]
MKFFILYFTDKDGVTNELYLKGKSMNHMLERIESYSNGILSSSKGTLYMSELTSAFLQEVNLNIYPNLSKRDFGIINENRSYNLNDLLSSD